MKTNFWKFLLQLLHDNRGSLSLTGDAGGASGGDGAGDSGSDPGPVSGEPAPLNEDGDPAPGKPVGTSVLSGLPEDIREDPSLKVFMDDKGNVSLENLAKSYVHAQRKIGERGVPLPGKNATDEEWMTFYNNVRPEDLAKYEVQNTLTDGVALDQNLFDGFKATAHKAGLSQKQAQGVIDWFNGVTAQSQQELSKTQQDSYDKEVKQLQADWGDAFKQEVALANRAVKEFADESTLNYLRESGLDGNVQLIRLFNKIGRGLLEDKFENESHGTFGVTKEDAQKKMAVIYGDQSHPYWNKEHPSHNHAVQEMMKLQEASLG